jgi:galactonate dehydratase
MKITEVRAFVVQLPKMWTNYVFVKVSTDGGIVGWGECSVGMESIKAVVEELGATLVGKDPFRIHPSRSGWSFFFTRQASGI